MSRIHRLENFRNLYLEGWLRARSCQESTLHMATLGACYNGARLDDALSPVGNIVLQTDCQPLNFIQRFFHLADSTTLISKRF